MINIDQCDHVIMQLTQKTLHFDENNVALIKTKELVTVLMVFI